VCSSDLPISDYPSNSSGQVKVISAGEFWKIPVDILIPASVTDVINETNKHNKEVSDC
jgi:glutamate dehydrogenase/leucine dehydrogenase